MTCEGTAVRKSPRDSPAGYSECANAPGGQKSEPRGSAAGPNEKLMIVGGLKVMDIIRDRHH
jgi:hypothetical protein